MRSAKSYIARGTIKNPDLLLIVNDPSARGIRTAGRIRDRVFLAVNRDRGDAVVESDLPLVARIPEDRGVGEADLAGTPIVGIPQESPARAAVRMLAGWLVEECARRG